jgi:hypothetical protein
MMVGGYFSGHSDRHVAIRRDDDLRDVRRLRRINRPLDQRLAAQQLRILFRDAL